MAVMELNALSINLSGSFSATVYLPENVAFTSSTPALYPVLYLLHDTGGDETDFRSWKNLERIATEQKLFIVAPGIAHSMGQDLTYGAKYGRFLAEELPGICSHLFPVNPHGATIGGVGTGAYGAVMLALQHPEQFARCITFNGVFDLATLCETALRQTQARGLTVPMLQAVFGPLDAVRGSAKDALFEIARYPQAALYLGCEDACPDWEESVQFARQANCPVQMAPCVEMLLQQALGQVAN